MTFECSRIVGSSCRSIFGWPVGITRKISHFTLMTLNNLVTLYYSRYIFPQIAQNQDNYDNWLYFGVFSVFGAFISTSVFISLYMQNLTFDEQTKGSILYRYFYFISTFTINKLNVIPAWYLKFRITGSARDYSKYFYSALVPLFFGSLIYGVVEILVAFNFGSENLIRYIIIWQLNFMGDGLAELFPSILKYNNYNTHNINLFNIQNKFQTTKSFEGCLASFISTLIFLILIGIQFEYFKFDWINNILISLFYSIIEACSPHGMDNIVLFFVICIPVLYFTF